MTILLVSDSHGHPDRLREAIERARPDCILFAGDGLRDMETVQEGTRLPTWAVRGNCDLPWGLTGRYAEEELVTLEGRRILLLHGHTVGVKSGLDRAVARAVERQADVLVFGHTHEPFEQSLRIETAEGEERTLLLCNPGSVGHYPHSFGTLTLQGGQILFGTGELT